VIGTSEPRIPSYIFLVAGESREGGLVPRDEEHEFVKGFKERVAR
jgi:hypothetical protein